MHIIFLLSIFLITSSCNQKVKEMIGIVTQGPDEYKVQRNKSLEVPPHYHLPSPKTQKKETDVNNNISKKGFNYGEKALMEEIEKSN